MFKKSIKSVGAHIARNKWKYTSGAVVAAVGVVAYTLLGDKAGGALTDAADAIAEGTIGAADAVADAI